MTDRQPERGVCPNCKRFYVVVIVRNGKKRCPGCNKELGKVPAKP